VTRFGAKRVLVLGLLAQAFGASGYVFVRNSPRSIPVAALFGFIYAGTMRSMPRSPARIPLRMMGTVDRRHRHGRSLAWRRDRCRRSDLRHLRQLRLASYIGSLDHGARAFLIALTFRAGANGTCCAGAG